ncbi:2-polyprenyl-6-methoxyphenol hydroxylase-like FAD-dependent oxidoreductase [Erwinia persicina]|jgi:2-polyprenyl-6-methoxyphenol hydroxylase-like FAD-dependent oxidoreductase|nr:2-polyprenyl-6-methoxyphenol hydroxylase-like FAD-dependent oxidoreductase [Erwinia persicina]
MTSSRASLPSSCCIAGAGPAGLMLGYLLARNSIPVTVLEKHADFLRDFRGDTIHPSTLEIIWRLGFLEEFLALPHQKAERLSGEIDGQEATMADFTRLPTQCKYIAFMPQWDFLNFINAKAAELPGFTLIHNAQVDGLIEAQGKVCGVKATIDGEQQEIRSELVIGCDGRNSAVRKHADLAVQNFGAPCDVLWLKIAKLPDDPE